MNKPSVYLIDASIYVFKSYFSVPDEFKSQAGDPINAVYGFIRFLTQFIHQTKAQYIACAFDESLASSFRNEIYPPYKANREPAPAELKKQFRICQKVTRAMGIATFSDDSYEADDLIGTLANHYQQKDHQVYVVSADKDLTQLIGKKDFWWNYGKNEPFGPRQIQQKFGVYPNQIADYLALTGDSVDNIPGVPGIGPKTASKLLQHFKTLEQLLNRKNEINYLSFRGAKSCKKKISDHLDELHLARKLTGIVTDVPINDLNITRKNVNDDKINLIFDYLNFGPMLRRK
ncbi:MAG TPA: exodeoxyribonuclease IX, partial [Oceanospirillales bacterium]|nr:exodeoxyribonuclease IX [Oceanospirillales bacterium]